MTPNTPKDSCAPLDMSLLTDDERAHNGRLVRLLESMGAEPTDSYPLNYLLSSLAMAHDDEEISCEVSMLRLIARSLITARSELKAERERNAALVEALGKIRDFTRKSGINEETRAVFAMTDMREIARAALSQSTQEKE